MRTLPRPETLLDGLLFPESPRWHEGRLWFSDIHGHRVMTVTPDGEPAVVAECMFRPSGIGFPEDGPPVVVNMLERRLMRLDDGGPTAIADLSGVARGNINDLVLDGHGRAYIGDLDVPEEPGSPRPEGLRPFGRRVVDYFTRGGQPLHAPGWGRLIRVDPDGSSTVVAEELLVPNGAVIAPDGRTLVVAETYANRLTAFDIEADGSLSRRRVFAQVGESTPDGICLDEDGAIWIASIYERRFLRVMPGGDVTDAIELPEGKLALACMLGGEDRRTLFLCTVVRPTMQVVPGVTRGAIEAVRVEVPGAGLP